MVTVNAWQSSRLGWDGNLGFRRINLSRCIVPESCTMLERLRCLMQFC